MSTDRKPTPEELWDAVRQIGIDDEAERILSLSDEELDAELRKHGFDPAAVRAEGKALAARVREAAGQGSTVTPEATDPSSVSTPAGGQPVCPKP